MNTVDGGGDLLADSFQDLSRAMVEIRRHCERLESVGDEMSRHERDWTLAELRKLTRAVEWDSDDALYTLDMIIRDPLKCSLTIEEIDARKRFIREAVDEVKEVKAKFFSVVGPSVSFSSKPLVSSRSRVLLHPFFFFHSKSEPTFNDAERSPALQLALPSTSSSGYRYSRLQEDGNGGGTESLLASSFPLVHLPPPRSTSTYDEDDTVFRKFPGVRLHDSPLHRNSDESTVMLGEPGDSLAPGNRLERIVFKLKKTNLDTSGERRCRVALGVVASLLFLLFLLIIL